MSESTTTRRNVLLGAAATGVAVPVLAACGSSGSGDKVGSSEPPAGPATITGGDEQYTNGVVHHIDALLVPAKAASGPAVGQKVGK